MMNNQEKTIEKILRNLKRKPDPIWQQDTLNELLDQILTQDTDKKSNKLWKIISRFFDFVLKPKQLAFLTVMFLMLTVGGIIFLPDSFYNDAPLFDIDKPSQTKNQNQKDQEIKLKKKTIEENTKNNLENVKDSKLESQQNDLKKIETISPTPSLYDDENKKMTPETSDKKKDEKITSIPTPKPTQTRSYQPTPQFEPTVTVTPKAEDNYSKPKEINENEVAETPISTQKVKPTQTTTPTPTIQPTLKPNSKNEPSMISQNDSDDIGSNSMKKTKICIDTGNGTYQTLEIYEFELDHYLEKNAELGTCEDM